MNNPTAKICSRSTCQLAGQLQPITAFSGDGHGQKASACLACLRKYANDRRRRVTKECSSCGEVKPLVDFHWRSDNRQHRAQCKNCFNTIARSACLQRNPRETTGHMRALTVEEVTPCPRCHLRGHVPGDPERCTRPNDPTSGMGSQWWT